MSESKQSELTPDVDVTDNVVMKVGDRKSMNEVVASGVQRVDMRKVEETEEACLRMNITGDAMAERDDRQHQWGGKG